MSKLVIPQPDSIAKMTAHELDAGIKALAERGIALLNQADKSDDDRSSIADIQAATALMGERLDQIKADAAAVADFEAMQARTAGRVPDVNPDDVNRAKTAGDLYDLFKASPAGQAAMKAWASKATSAGGMIEVPTHQLLKGRWTPGYLAAMGVGAKGVLGTDDSLTDVDQEIPPRTIRWDDPVLELTAPRNIAELFPNYPWSGEAVEFLVENIVTDNAKETPEGALADESAIEFEAETSVVRKITTTLPVTMEGLGVETWLRGHVQNRLRGMVQDREDLQLLRGTGASSTLIGINSADGTQTEYAGASPDGQALAESIFKAAIKVGQSFLTPTAAIINLDTWSHLRLAKDKEDRYLNSIITESGVARVFGLRLHFNERQLGVTSPGSGNVVATVVARDAAAVFRRMGVAVTWTDSHTDRFARDITTFKATSRLALAVFRPAGIVRVVKAAS